MASQQQGRKQQEGTTKAHDEEGAQGQGQQAMNLEEIGKYRAEAQQRSADAIRAAEDRFNKANNNQARAGGGAHGTVTVTYQETAKPGDSHGSESEAQRWLADAAADARERCNKAMGMAAGDAPPHQQQAKSEQEGGHGQAHLTRQDEMGKHGSEAQKSATAEAARAAVHDHDKGVKDTGAQSAEEKAQEATGTAAEYTKQAAAKVKDVTAGAAGTAAEYAKQAAARAKEAAQGTGETAAEYARQAAAKGKEVTVSTGGTAAEYARAAAEKAREAAVATARTTAGYTQQAAVKAKDVTVSAGAQAAHKATEVTADAARRVAEFAREKAEQGKERAAQAADQAEEPAGCGAAAQAKDTASQTADKARDMAGQQHKDGARDDDTAGGMARKAAETAVQAKEKVKDTAASMFQKAGDTAGHAKDTAKDAGGGMVQRSRDAGEQKAGEVKERASGTGQTGGATAKAKGGDDSEGTTVVGDVLEAVGATVVGLAQHAKGILAGEEELVPVQGEKREGAGGDEEEKRKLA